MEMPATASRALESLRDERKLTDLTGVGRSIARNLNELGIHSVEDLAARSPEQLYDQLGAREGVRPDPCVLDTFRCAVAQARNPRLSPDQKNWWWWSRQRKAGLLG